MSVKNALQDIYEAHGELRPEMVVLTAMSEDHELHPHFTWDDGVAGHKHRLTEAMRMIRQVKVIIEIKPQTEPIQVRAFISGEDCAAGVGTYLNVRDVINDDFLRAAWFSSMERDWKRLLYKYQVHKEFSEMVLNDIRDLVH